MRAYGLCEVVQSKFVCLCYLFFSRQCLKLQIVFQSFRLRINIKNIHKNTKNEYFIHFSVLCGLCISLIFLGK